MIHSPFKRRIDRWRDAVRRAPPATSEQESLEKDMSHPLLEKHRATLEGALHAIATRGYWSAYDEMPSPRAYGETGDGRQAGLRGLTLAGSSRSASPARPAGMGGEESPYGIAIGTTYPVCDSEALIAAGEKAMSGWQAAGADGRTGICLEILDRLNRRASRSPTR
jgi:hypothetical protein